MSVSVDRALDELVRRGTHLAHDIDDVAPMTCLEAGSERPYGDVVPAGILLAGLRSASANDLADRVHPPIGSAIEVLSTWLARRRTELGFAFHTGTLPTATDSSLTLVGFHDAGLVDGLSRYVDEDGGVLPQLVGSGDGRMRSTAGTAHWEIADDLTTALTYHLRATAGLDPVTDPAWFTPRADTRASVFVANPWIVDWSWALAARALGGAARVELRRTLGRELAASANPDGSFGRADERPLATAAAGAAAHALGDAFPRPLLMATRERLAELLLEGAPAQIPFASSTRCLVGGSLVPGAPGRFGMVMLEAGDEGLATPGDEIHLLARYRDDSAVVLTGLGLLALAPGARIDAGATELDASAGVAHARYRCASLRDYFERFALPPALARATATATVQRPSG